MPTQKRNVKRKYENRTPVRYQRPSSLSPWGKGAGIQDQNGSVWIKMKPSKILDQTSKGAGTISTQDINTEFIFLAPLTLNENIVHHWEAYESVASRLAQKARSAVKLGAEAAALSRVFGETLTEGNFKNIFEKTGSKEGASIERYATKAYNAVPGSRIPNIKVDTPLYYTNSDRRQIIFEFVLFNEKLSNDPEEALIKPIKELMKFSSPDLKGSIQIEFPYIWDIRTIPNEFIHYSTCALVAVQPTWNSPYINHVPSSCNLQLTFTDMSPLYAGTIESGSIVNVISNRKRVNTRVNPANGQIQRIDPNV